MNLGGVQGATGQFEAAADCFGKVIHINPMSAPAQARLAQALLALGRTNDAIPHFERALELNARDSASIVRLAWVRATSKDADLRNGRQALELIQSLDSANGQNNPRVLDTLAAAWAEVGEFDLAVTAAERGLRCYQLNTRCIRQLRLEEKHIFGMNPTVNSDQGRDQSGSSPVELPSLCWQAWE